METRPSLKLWKKLKTRRGRSEQKAFLVEGPRAIVEGISVAGYPEELVVDCHRCAGPLAELVATCEGGGTRVWKLPTAMVGKLAATRNTQGVLARFALPNTSQPLDTDKTIVILDQVQDPGNVGSILRHGAAFGLDLVVCVAGTADPFGPKAVRASMGGIFHLRVIDLPSAEEASRMFPSIDRVFVLRSEGGQDVWKTTFPERLVLVVGNEARGPAPVWSRHPSLHLPQRGEVESCNAAFVVSLVLAMRHAGRGPA